MSTSEDAAARPRLTRRPLWRRPPACLLAAAVLTSCAGSSSGAVPVTAPSPARQVAAFCDRLHDALPHRLDGRTPAQVSPDSPLTAAWGDPAVVLRCGVPKPRSLESTSEVIEIDGVQWFLHETNAAYVFTTVGREAYVQVRIPTEVPREQATAPLVDLARPVTSAVPTTDDFSEGP